MSRIGKKPVAIPQGVTINVDKNIVSVAGPKGSLQFQHHVDVAIEVSSDSILVEKIGKGKNAPAIWGTTARIIGNMFEGVTVGFKKQLELNGVGFRMALAGKTITLALGFSHPVVVEVPVDLDVIIEGNTMTVSGIDKHKVGQFSANIRALKPVEPYKGKGFKYVGEHVRRKEGKKSSK